jgi:hypothetical protein
MQADKLPEKRASGGCIKIEKRWKNMLVTLDFKWDNVERAACGGGELSSRCFDVLVTVGTTTFKDFTLVVVVVTQWCFRLLTPSEWTRANWRLPTHWLIQHTKHTAREKLAKKTAASAWSRARAWMRRNDSYPTFVCLDVFSRCYVVNSWRMWQMGNENIFALNFHFFRVSMGEWVGGGWGRKEHGRNK